MNEIVYIGSQVDDEESALAKFIEAAQTHGAFAVDTETVSLKDRDGIGIGLWADNVGLYVSWKSPLLAKVLNLLADDIFTKLYYNAMFDLRVERNMAYELDSPSVPVEPPDCYNIEDVSIMGHVQAMPNALADISLFILQLHIDEISDVLPIRKNMLDLEFQVVAAKCLDDVKATWQLYYAMDGPSWKDSEAHSWRSPLGRLDEYLVTEGMKDCYRVDMELMPILLDMGERGIALRQDKVLEWKNTLTKQLTFLTDMFYDLGMNNVGTSINPASTQQVGLLLANRGNVLPMTKSGKHLRTDDETLSRVKDPIASAVLQYRSLRKLKGTYIDPAVAQERMYSSYRLDLATGRLASSDRNMQNIPAKVRDIFAPDSGQWTIADASQIEMRCFAYLSNDPVMLPAYIEGRDIHAITQLTLWPGSDINNKASRTRAKNFNFAMLADANPQVLAKTTGLDANVCAKFKETWYAIYPRSKPWIEEQQVFGLSHGYQETIFGNKMRLPEPAIANERHILKCSVNYPFQGSAAGINKRGMLLCHKAGLTIATQVHDEIVLDGDAEFPMEAENVFPGLRTPYEVVRNEDWVKK